MIDIENEVFNTVANSLRAEFPNISIYGEYVETPESFPCVCLVEDENTDDPAYMPLTREEPTVSNLMYSANVYSNLTTGKKKQAKTILDSIDKRMHKLGFTRVMRSQLPNVDRTIYRVTARYTKVIQIF